MAKVTRVPLEEWGKLIARSGTWRILSPSETAQLKQALERRATDQKPAPDKDAQPPAAES